MKPNNLFYLFLNQLNFNGADCQHLKFLCSNVDFNLIPDDVNVCIFINYELNKVRFDAYRGVEEWVNYELISSVDLAIDEASLVKFRDWVISLTPKSP